MNLNQLYQEMLEEEPTEIILEPRPQIPTDPINVQGKPYLENILKRRKGKIGNKCSYICSISEKFLNSTKTPIETSRNISIYYLRNAIKMYQLFSILRTGTNLPDETYYNNAYSKPTH